MLPAPALRHRRLLPPVSLPVLFFAGVILTGAVLLRLPACVAGGRLSWTDALFTATSATCVTGLVVVDTGTFFSPLGQGVILLLIQAGGLGIMTFTSLASYLVNQRVSLTDRVAVGQLLLHDPTFHLGGFLKRMVLWTMIIEGAGALCLKLLAPREFDGFSALFHAVSAFCNAGFSLFADSLCRFRGDAAVNFVFIVLIVAGGLGFSVLVELQHSLTSHRPRRGQQQGRRPRLSWYSRIVLTTSFWLVILGWFGILTADFIGFSRPIPDTDALLASLFQSVTCRTAGFNTLTIGDMTNVSLAVMILLMFIGGAPGSCAGGVKVTTARVLWGFAAAQLRGRPQVVVQRQAVDRETLDRALTLFFFAGALVFGATLLLAMTEGGDAPHPMSRGSFLELLFEATSAFGTVGLSTGITPGLTFFGKYILIGLMFVGRLGPLVFLAAIQAARRQPAFRWPEDSLLIG